MFVPESLPTPCPVSGAGRGCWACPGTRPPTRGTRAASTTDAARSRTGRRQNDKTT